MQNAKPQFKNKVTTVCLVAGALVLAIDPLAWLIRTWHDPVYASKGFPIFCALLALFVWSVTSTQSTSRSSVPRWPYGLLLVTALIRVVGQILSVNVIGALALVIDVYAIAILAGLPYRQRSLSPFWLAVCFAYTLPLERLVQRLIGYGLQHISADGACLLLSRWFENVHCQGVRIWIDQQDVLVDLPCSGARTVLLLQLLFAACMAVSKPGFVRGFIGLGITLATSLAVNVLRISVLAIGMAHPEVLWDIDVMDEVWHQSLGLGFLALGSLPIILWARRIPRSQNALLETRRPVHLSPGTTLNPLLGALIFLIVSLVIINLPPKPIDQGRKDLSIRLPELLDGVWAKHIPLLAKEKRYFTQYGGSASKAQYGDMSLLMVNTSAPLRHLHSPDECLRSLGFRVEYVGTSFDSVPTAIYKATHPDGQAYRVAVTFYSNQGQTTPNVSQAVWFWMQKPQGVWTAVQRISPWGWDQEDLNRWDQTVFAALDLFSRPSNIS